MNNTSLTKWGVLLSLLVLTLILVWQAPETDTAGVVEPVKQTNRSANTNALNSSTSVAANAISLKERHFSGQAVDLFSSPVSPEPTKSEVIINRPVIPPPQTVNVQLPFQYVGKLEEQQKVIYFLLEGRALYPVQEGDVINEQFRLQRVDAAGEELVWLYLPTNEIRKMSIKQ